MSGFFVFGVRSSFSISIVAVVVTCTERPSSYYLLDVQPLESAALFNHHHHHHHLHVYLDLYTTCHNNIRLRYIPVHHTIQVIRSFTPLVSARSSSSFILVFVWATCMWLMLMPFKRWFTIKFVIMHICFVPQPVFGCDTTFSSGVVVFRWDPAKWFIYRIHFFSLFSVRPLNHLLWFFILEKLAFARWLIRCCLLLLISLSTAQSLSLTPSASFAGNQFRNDSRIVSETWKVWEQSMVINTCKQCGFI